MISDNKYVLNNLESDLGLEVSASKVWGITPVTLLGYNTDLDSAGAEDVWDGGGTYTFGTTAEELFISSSSASDTTEVTVTGLDANYIEQSVAVTLVGQTKTRVGTTETFRRINGLEMSTVADNVGDVYVYANGNVAQVDTITLTGTAGTADVTVAGGLTKTATFNTDLSTTASDFVTAHAAAYLAEDIVVTSDAEDIIFTASVAGTGFDSPVITNATGDLAGSVANTTANSNGVSSGVPAVATLIRGKINAAENKTYTSVYTVPANKTLFLKELLIGESSLATGVVAVTLKARELDNRFKDVGKYALKATGDSLCKVVYEIPKSFPAKTDLKITTTTSVDNASIVTELNGLLRDS